MSEDIIWRDALGNTADWYFDKNYSFIITREHLISFPDRIQRHLKANCLEPHADAKEGQNKFFDDVLSSASKKFPKANNTKIRNSHDYPDKPITAGILDRTQFKLYFGEGGFKTVQGDCIEHIKSGKPGKRMKDLLVPCTEFGVFLDSRLFTALPEHSEILNIEYILEQYRNFSEHTDIVHRIIVISMDRLLEHERTDLLWAISAYLKAGHELIYATTIDSGGDTVRDHWRSVCATLRQIDENHRLPELWGLSAPEYAVRASDVHRQVFILEKSLVETSRLFTYMRTDVGALGVRAPISRLGASLASANELQRDFWIESSAMRCQAEYEQFERKVVYKLSEPINLGHHSRQPHASSEISQLQSRYEKMFSASNKLNKHYDATIKLISENTCHSNIVEKLVHSVLSNSVNQTDLEPFRILDVGAGARNLTAQVVDEVKAHLTPDGPNARHSYVRPVQCVAIDSIYISPDKTIRMRPDIIFEETRFQEFESLHRYDLITFIHSTYVLEHDMLIKAIGMLKPGGTLSILSSPACANPVNMITVELDRFLVEMGYLVLTNKAALDVLPDDPFRNYSEDTLTFLERCTCPDIKAATLEYDEVNDTIPVNLVIGPDGLLTETFWNLFKMFGQEHLEGYFEDHSGSEGVLREKISQNILQGNLWLDKKGTEVLCDNSIINLRLSVQI